MKYRAIERMSRKTHKDKKNVQKKMRSSLPTQVCKEPVLHHTSIRDVYHTGTKGLPGNCHDIEWRAYAG